MILNIVNSSIFIWNYFIYIFNIKWFYFELFYSHTPVTALAPVMCHCLGDGYVFTSEISLLLYQQILELTDLL